MKPELPAGAKDLAAAISGVVITVRLAVAEGFTPRVLTSSVVFGRVPAGGSWWGQGKNPPRQGPLPWIADDLSKFSGVVRVHVEGREEEVEQSPGNAHAGSGNCAALPETKMTSIRRTFTERLSPRARRRSAKDL